MNPLRAYRRFWPMYQPVSFAVGLLALPILAVILAGGLGEDRGAAILLGVLCGVVAALPSILAKSVCDSSLARTLPFRRDLRLATWGSTVLLGMLVFARAWTWSCAIGAGLGIAFMVLTVGLLSLDLGVALLLSVTLNSSWDHLPEAITSPVVVIPSGLVVGLAALVFSLGNRHLRFRAQGGSRGSFYWTSSIQTLATTETAEFGDRPLLNTLGWKSPYRLPDRSFRSWLQACSFEGSRLPPGLGIWLRPSAAALIWWLVALFWTKVVGWEDLIQANLLLVGCFLVAFVAAGSVAIPPPHTCWHPISRERRLRLHVAAGGLSLLVTLAAGCGAFLLLPWLLARGIGTEMDALWLRGALGALALMTLSFPWIRRLVATLVVGGRLRHFVLFSIIFALLSLIHTLWLRFSGPYPTPAEGAGWLLATLAVYSVDVWRTRRHYLREDLV